MSISLSGLSPSSPFSSINIEITDRSLKSQHKATAPACSKVQVGPDCFLHVEESGNPEGIPAVFFHGGPGERFKSTDHQWFDPEKYRIIAFQQRGTWGCSPSANNPDTPSQVFKDVTIDTIVEDIEVLRATLNIEKWLVFGGSWGSTLSVFYAEEHPERCLGVVLRGIFLATPKENALFFNEERHKKQCGEDWKPEALTRIESYAKSKGLDIDLNNPPTIYAAYKELCVMQNDRTAQRIWTAFEDFADDPKDPANYERLMNDDHPIEERDCSVGIWEPLMFDTVSRTYNLLDEKRLEKLKGLPVQVVQGAEDKLCHHSIAQELVDGLKKVECPVKYALIEGGGHSPYHPAMTDALVRATDSFADNSKF